MEKNSNNLNKNDFDWYVEELYKINSSNPNRANSIARKGLDELGLLDKSKVDGFLGIDMRWVAIIVICILIELCVFLAPNRDAILPYIFGSVFFFAGLFVGLDVPIFGLIFLCSHGGIGLAIMLVSLLGGIENRSFSTGNIFNNPAFSDGGMPSNMKLYLWGILAVFITAIVYTLLHNLSPRLKENKIHMIAILLLYLLLIFLVGYFSKTFPNILN